MDKATPSARHGIGTLGNASRRRPQMIAIHQLTKAAATLQILQQTGQLRGIQRPLRAQQGMVMVNLIDPFGHQ